MSKTPFGWHWSCSVTGNRNMKALLAIVITVSLLVACYIVSALIYFDLTWILIGVTSFWAAIDSKRIELNRYKLGFACRPIVLFCLCYLLWILIFPWYLWARFKINAGALVLKDEPVDAVGKVKRFFRRFSRGARWTLEWCLIFLVTLKMAILLFCIEESWRGPRVWENYKSELEAKGESFDWDAMIPAPVPAAQNIFNAPMMSVWFIKPSGKIDITEDLTKRLNYPKTSPAVMIAQVVVEPLGVRPHAKTTGTTLQFGDFNSHQRARELIQKVIGPCALGVLGHATLTAQPLDTNHIQPAHIVLETDRKPDAKDLIAFFTGQTAGAGPLVIRAAGTNSYRVLTSLCPASDYLQWSDQFQSDFDLMRRGLQRPYARMDGDYQYPPSMPIPNFVNVRVVAQTLAQRAQCCLLLGEPDKALQELTLLNNLRRLLEAAPSGKPMSLVSAMINVAITGLYADIIAEGFRLHAWQEPQLVVLQKQLAQINLAPFVKESFHEEAVSACRILQAAMARFEIQLPPNPTLWQKIKHAHTSNFMRGFYYFSIINVVKTDEMIADSINPSQKVVWPKETAGFQHEVERLNRAHPWQVYKLLAIIAVPDFTKAVQTFAFNQTKMDEAQIVCALERYRLARGKYPEALNDLVPQFIDKLPHDIIGGQALKYHPTTDGQFLLYSVGWNETDDDGQLSVFPYDHGDWIWQ